MAELVDALDLGSSGVTRGGSSPPSRMQKAPVSAGVIGNKRGARGVARYTMKLKLSHEARAWPWLQAGVEAAMVAW
jgi:hypothetical protein